MDTGDMLEDSCMPSESIRDLGGFHRDSHVSVIIIRGEFHSTIIWEVAALELATVQKELPHDAGDGATEIIATPGVCNLFAFVPIFLRREDKVNGCCCLQLRFRCSGVVQASVSKEEANIAKRKRLIVGDCAGVFAWAETEEVCQANHVCNRLTLFGRAFVVGKRECLCDNPQWAWLYSVWGRILLAVSTELGGESEVELACNRETGIRGPHPGKRLPDRPYGVRHCSSCNGVAAGGQSAVSVADAKDLEEGHWIFDPVEQRIDSMFGAEIHPDGPISILPGGIRRVNSTSHRELQSAEVKFESVCKFSRHMRHGLSCG